MKSENQYKQKRLVVLGGGLSAGVAGVIASSRIYSSDANNIGLNMELDAILAVALGGNSLGGGKFSIAGSVLERLQFKRSLQVCMQLVFQQINCLFTKLL